MVVTVTAKNKKAAIAAAKKKRRTDPILRQLRQDYRGVQAERLPNRYMRNGWRVSFT